LNLESGWEGGKFQIGCVFTNQIKWPKRIKRVEHEANNLANLAD